jgi:predicted small secreted protein
MAKYIYCALILISTLSFSGCETCKGFSEDVQNIPNPDKNGWNALERADAWMQENLW